MISLAHGPVELINLGCNTSVLNSGILCVQGKDVTQTISEITKVIDGMKYTKCTLMGGLSLFEKCLILTRVTLDKLLLVDFRNDDNLRDWIDIYFEGVNDMLPGQNNFRLQLSSVHVILEASTHKSLENSKLKWHYYKCKNKHGPS